MKILYLKWDSFGDKFVQAALKKSKNEVIVFDFPRETEDTRNSEKLTINIVNTSISEGVDILFSLNYYPVAAIAAAACKIKYVSWTYDSPYIQLYSKTIDYPTNYAFVFDKAEYINLRNKGVDRVFYLPMAADTDFYSKINLSANDRIKYNADIAMIGSMYTERKHDLIRHFEGLDEYTAGYIEGIMEAQKNIYGLSVIEGALNNDIIKNVQKVCPVMVNGDGYEDIEWVLANYFIARKLTGMERFEYIKALSEKYNVTLYTHNKTPDLKVDNKGPVDYYDQAPKAIKCAKINLNITLRSIVSGIPLRAMDIMGCGGFLLTNYQSDFEEYFEAGKDYVYFDSKADLIEKAGYYLSHDEEREEIARSGLEKMKAYHTYDIRIKQMLSMINE